MLEELYRASPRDVESITAGRDLKLIMAQFGKSDTGYKISLSRKYKVTCAKGEKMAAAYRSYLETVARVQPLRTQFSYVNSLKLELDSE